jgi:hypothetical protein
MFAAMVAKDIKTFALAPPQAAEILAAGLQRVFTRKSSGKAALASESSLDFSASESGHTTPLSRRVLNG